ncbi:low temperature requirement protein A [Undibacterium sp. Rencai35W]|uniref:low temperature requirement protein A n=1 Tax=Undibacterium sp. Rencai35W TaxID=3413046 RepID=UPI003BEFD316
MTSTHNKLLRQRHGHAKVTNIELFFDLVFVFAVTQLSHRLLKDLSLMGAVQTSLLFLAVWWVWVYTSWVTNWLDPEKTPVRILLFAMMLAGLLLSASLPQAFGNKGLAFALVFVAMQVGRSVFMLWALRHEDGAVIRNFQRITTWLVLSGIFWISGGLADDAYRLLLWTIALGIEYISPSLGFWTPGLGRSLTSDWNVEGAHLAERCSLFIIIALGESILVTGATFAELDWTTSNALAFFFAFIGSVAMWWIYFNIGAERGSEHIAQSADPGHLARLVYTYIHLLIVGGIIVGAVGDELALAHPHATLDPAHSIAMIAGPLLFLLGNLPFKWISSGKQHAPLSHLAGLGLMAALSVLAFVWPAMTATGLAGGMSAILLLVAIWETCSLRA